MNNQDSGDRRFGGVSKLYGQSVFEKIKSCHVVVVGLGGVGSWVVEALSRSGVQKISLIDLDHVSISNTNRQIQALDGCFGLSKTKASSNRALLINPNIHVNEIEEWVDPDNINRIFESIGYPVDAILDCTDQVSAKAALVCYAQQNSIPLILSGAAGGKLSPQQLQIMPLSRTTHDPLLTKVRSCLRKQYGGAGLTDDAALLIRAIFSTELVKYPQQSDDACVSPPDRQGLNCGGFGSSLLVTGTMAFLMVYALFEQWQNNQTVN